MALITCPECGGQISTNAKQCIHCGCEVKVCPECNNVYVSNTHKCEKCGFRFLKQKEKDEKKENCLDLYNNCKNCKTPNTLSNLFFSSTIRAISIFLTLLSIILAVVAYFKFDSWATSDPLVAIFKYNETKNTIIALIIVVLVVVLGDLILDAFLGDNDSLNVFRFFNPWLNSNNKNLSISIQNYLTTDNLVSKTKESLERDKKILDKCIDCQQLNNVFYRQKREKQKIFTVTIDCIIAIILAICLIVYVKSEMQQTLIDFNNSKNVVDNSSRIIKVVLLSVAIIAIFVYASIRNKRIQVKRNEFVKNKFPKEYEIYIKYFDTTIKK